MKPRCVLISLNLMGEPLGQLVGFFLVTGIVGPSVEKLILQVGLMLDVQCMPLAPKLASQ